MDQTALKMEEEEAQEGKVYSLFPAPNLFYPRRGFMGLFFLRPVLLLIAVDSPAYSVLISSNISLGLPFMDLVTTTQKLVGTQSMNRNHFTVISSTNPCVQFCNMSMVDFHGTSTNGIMVDMEILALSLTTN